MCVKFCCNQSLQGWDLKGGGGIWAPPSSHNYEDQSSPVKLGVIINGEGMGVVLSLAEGVKECNAGTTLLYLARQFQDCMSPSCAQDIWIPQRASPAQGLVELGTMYAKLLVIREHCV